MAEGALTDQRTALLNKLAAHFDGGDFQTRLARRIAIATESEEADSGPALRRYLDDEIAAQLRDCGFSCTVHDAPIAVRNLFLTAQRIEDPGFATILLYGHGDVVRGQANRWHTGLNPWQLQARDGRWYGRGSADNKGQHTIHVDALAAVIAQRGGKLGFNLKVLFEMGEETGSPGLRAFAEQHRDLLSADLLIACDGPRVSAASPTIFLGSRGIINVQLNARFRDSGHHSGNWGGLLANPATVLCNLIAGWVDQRGRLRADVFKPPAISAAVKQALHGVPLEAGPDAPRIDQDWGEDGLTPAERVYAWNTLEVLAIESGNAERPVNAIPGSARATLQLRFVVGTDIDAVVEKMRRDLTALAFPGLELDVTAQMAATRMAPDHPLVRWAADSIRMTAAKPVTILPNLGGSLPNDVFAEVLGLPTIWVPHSYPACLQHAPNEHLLPELAREGLQIMAGLYYDFSAIAAGIVAARKSRRQRAQGL